MIRPVGRFRPAARFRRFRRSLPLRAALCAGALVALVAALATADTPTPASSPASSPHDRSLIGDRDCSECHTPDGWSLSGGRGRGFDHAETGFPLTGTHASVLCTSCHVAERKITRDCAGCHRDAHQGRMGVQCDQCHSSRTWNDTRAIERHRRTRLPLSGVHALLPCTSCHLRTTESTWAHVPADCFSCHEKDYRRDIHPVHQGDPALTPFPRDCERCHVAPETPRLVMCLGCHEHSPARLRQTHGGAAVATDAAGCLRCHPGGSAR
jgi:hypothetical protein